MDLISVVVISDIHLGTIIGKSRFDSIVSKINMMKPDIVLLPGDIVDEDLGPVIKQNLGESLLNVKSRYGIFAVTGNHEYIGGVEEACAYLSAHGVRVLRDEAVRINNSFYLIGREDRIMPRFAGRQRKSMSELTDGIPAEFPILLMDHQPFEVEESMEYGIDLQVSGHTHHGQLWPLNYITNAVYLLSWGYRKDGNRHLYVSCGVGTWGPPVRLGNRPEIVNFKLTFH
jgi:predicted MPP superfamily phosphohydrolase